MGPSLLLLLGLLPQARGETGQRPAPPAATKATTSQQCSFERPVCVEGRSKEARQRALGLLAEAFELMVLGSAAPSWPLDPHAQPLLWQLADGPLAFSVERAPSLGFDRGRVHCRGGEVTRTTALACVAGSSASRLAPATAPALTQGIAGYLAHGHDGGQATLLAATRARSRPEQGVLSDPSAPTAALLVEHLVAKAEPGQGAFAAWSALVLAATKTKPGAPKLDAEPDALDVLLATFGPGDAHLARFFDEMAVGRWSRVGPFGREIPLPELAWDIDAASLPRNLVLPRPLVPTGSAYVSVRLDDRTRQDGLALRTFCEEGSRYVWSLARLNANDQILGRVPATGRESGTSAEGTLRELGGIDRVLIVGTSLGGAPGERLDPDETPLGAHSCEVVLDRLPGP